MFDFNPKLLLFIPATVIFYKLLSQKEEVNEEEEKNDNFQKSLTFKQYSDLIKFEKPKLPNRKMKTRNPTFKIMDDEIKKILSDMIDKIVEKKEKEEKEEKKEKEEKEEKEKKEKEEKEKEEKEK